MRYNLYLPTTSMFNAITIAIVLTMPASAMASAAPIPKSEAADIAAQAIAVPKENRIVRYTYSPDVIFRIYTSPMLHTHIELGEDEGLKEIPKTGDSIQWRVDGGPRNLYVKPVRGGVETSMTVVTNKRTYQFQLISGDKNTTLYQKVSFDYPDRDAEIRLLNESKEAAVSAESHRLDQQIIAKNVDPATLDFNYQIIGDAPFRPLTVYADEKFTYLRMPSIQDTPAIFLVDDKGNLSLVEFKPRDHLIIVERVVKNLLLKLGSTEVRIVKQDVNKNWWSN